MVVDYKVFEKAKENKTKEKKLFYVLEQTPGNIIYHDVSDYLYENSYYASFNRAFFSETKESLKLQLIKELYGDVFSSQGSQRRKIFKKLNTKVKDLKSFKDVLRYNGFKLNNTHFPDDPSKFYPGHAISARYDLETELNNLSGGLDCKV
jgi:hypothetical protein